MRVEAHIHIGRKRKGIPECMSVRPIGKNPGLVGYWSFMTLRDVTFSVQPAGLRKFRETGRKNVHAYTRGTIDHRYHLNIGWREVRYNPKVNDTFVDAETGAPVLRADRVMFDGDRLFYV